MVGVHGGISDEGGLFNIHEGQFDSMLMWRIGILQNVHSNCYRINTFIQAIVQTMSEAQQLLFSIFPVCVRKLPSIKLALQNYNFLQCPAKDQKPPG